MRRALAALLGVGALLARGADDDACGGKDPRGLLWQLRTKSNATTYLLATYRMGIMDVAPLPVHVQTAMECSDMAYFQYACSRKDYGSYNYHCTSYPMVGPNDSLATRLSSPDFVALTNALRQAERSAADGCETAASMLEAHIKGLENGNRTTLKSLRDLALSVLDPVGCKYDEGAKSYEEHLREWFSEHRRPVLGLEDIEAKCQMYRGVATQDDVSMAQQLTAELSNETWIAGYKNLMSSLVEVVRCGDLDAYQALLNFTSDVPYAGGTMEQKQNPSLAQAIMATQQQNPGKVLLIVLPMDHLFNMSGAAGILDILQASGYNIRRVTEDFQCNKSEYNALGTKDLNQCFLPVGQSQPESCSNFRTAVVKITGKDGLYGRTKNVSDCKHCLVVEEACDCAVQWGNTSAFKDMCNNLTVNGVTGSVYEFDLTRNPGSTRVGQAFSEKTVRGMHQHCVAKTCDIPLLQEEATRNWYAMDPTLSIGVVTLRLTDQPLGGSPPAWAVSPWIAGAFLAIPIVIGVLVVCFMMPKRDKQVRGRWQMGRGTYEAFEEEQSEATDSEVSPRSSRASPGSRSRAGESSRSMPVAAGSMGAMPPPMGQPLQQGQGPYPGMDGGPYGSSAPYGGAPAGMEPMSYLGMPPPVPPPQHSPPGSMGPASMPPMLPLGSMGPPQVPLPPRGPSGGLEGNLLLQQALEMSTRLGEAGAQAMQQMQLFGAQVATHGMHDSPTQSMVVPPGAAGPFATGSGFGSGYSPTSFNFVDHPLSPTGRSFAPAPGPYGQYGLDPAQMHAAYGAQPPPSWGAGGWHR